MPQPPRTAFRAACLLATTFAALAALAPPPRPAEAVTFEEAALAAGYTYGSTGTISVVNEGVDRLAGVNLFTAASSIAAANSIARIDVGQFSALGGLQSLYLSRNQIATVESGAFAGLGNLVYLDLNTNQIPALQPDLFSGLTSLRNLSLDGNQITSIGSGAFSDLAMKTLLAELAKCQVASLDLRGADLSAVTSLSPIRALEHLARLDLAYAKLPDVDEVDNVVVHPDSQELNHVTLSWDLWTLMDDLSQLRLIVWDADAGNTLVLVDRPGDANGDGKVDDLDASILAAHWQRAGDATWRTGDFNADGDVNDLDASILAAHWQAGATTAAVPEPAGWALLAGLAVAALKPGGSQRGRGKVRGPPPQPSSVVG